METELHGLHDVLLSVPSSQSLLSEANSISSSNRFCSFNVLTTFLPHEWTVSGPESLRSPVSFCCDPYEPPGWFTGPQASSTWGRVVRSSGTLGASKSPSTSLSCPLGLFYVGFLRIRKTRLAAKPKRNKVAIWSTPRYNMMNSEASSLLTFLRRKVYYSSTLTTGQLFNRLPCEMSYVSLLTEANHKDLSH